MLARVARSPALMLFSSSVLGQVVLSGSSFLVGLMLIRHSTDLDYGHYVLVQTTLMLVLGLQGAWITGPLTVLASKRPEAECREMVGAAYRGQQHLGLRVSAGLLLLVPLCWLAGWLDQEEAALAAATVLAIWVGLEREYLRAVLRIYTRANALLGVDAVYVAVLVAGVAIAIALASPVAAWAVLVLALAAWVANQPARRLLAANPGWSQAGAENIWAELRPLGIWAAGGMFVYWSFSQGYNYLLAARLDVQAVAAVAATRLLLMPVNLLTAGVKGILVPMASRWLPRLGIRGLIGRLSLLGLGLLLLSVVYVLLLWLFRDWVAAEVLKKEIADRDLMLLLWAVIFLLCLFRDCLQTVLFVRERFKALTYIAAVNAVASFAAMILLMEHYGAAGAVMGILIGELIYTLAVFELLRRESRMADAGPTEV